MGDALIPDVSGENHACLRDDFSFALLNYLLPKGVRVKLLLLLLAFILDVLVASMAHDN